MLVHRALVGDDAHPLIFVLEVVVELTDCVYVSTLTLGSVDADTHRGIDSLLALVEKRRRAIPGCHRISPSTQRDAPISHRASRVGG
jgi:hypothetical protein